MTSTSPQTILSDEIRYGKTPSVQYVFFDAESIIYEFSDGLSDIGSRKTPDQDTIFPIFSVTKTFTALSILQLAEKGSLNPGYPVRYYLPELEINPGITVKHLLTHTSGLNNPLPIRWIHLIDEHEQFNRDDFFRPLILHNLKNNSSAGTRFRYSNLGYVLLGQIIERITEMKYEKYVIKNILSKLKLNPDTIAFEIQDLQNMATGYHNRRSLSMLLLSMLLDTSKYMGTSIGKWKPFKKVYVNGISYGGLIANTYGMIKYARELLKSDSRLLSDEYRKKMFTEFTLNNGRQTGMCMSWYTGHVSGQTYFTHAGGGGGYYCELRLYPAVSRGSFIIFNRSGFSDERFLDKVDINFI